MDVKDIVQFRSVVGAIAVLQRAGYMVTRNKDRLIGTMGRKRVVIPIDRRELVDNSLLIKHTGTEILKPV